MLSAVDVLVLLKIAAKRGKVLTQPELAGELFISQSAVNRALKTATSLNLLTPRNQGLNATHLEEALSHGARYFLAPKRGGEVRGMLTAWAAPPLSHVIASSDPLPPVWPDPMGDARGLSLEPLHQNVPKAARLDAQLYELLAIRKVGHL